jgi:hypothetical protein
MEMKMKLLMVLLILAQCASAQIESGSVVVVDRQQGKLTVAADSRLTTDTGKYQDTECKIFAFGPKFIFTMAGVISIASVKWTAPSSAREIWERESNIPSNIPLLQRVANKWIEGAEKAYRAPGVVPDVRKHTTGVIVNAFFAEIDQSGKLQTDAVDIDFDRKLFDATGKVHISHDSEALRENSTLVGGLGEIVDEFNQQTSLRAKSYMPWFKAHIADLPLDKQHAELASKFVELSILLHPRRKELGFPIDVLQFQEGTGVRWVWHKANCSTQ